MGAPFTAPYTSDCDHCGDRITAADFERSELPVWNTALHNVAVRLGHPLHPEPAWLLLHDHS